MFSVGSKLFCWFCASPYTRRYMRDAQLPSSQFFRLLSSELKGYETDPSSTFLKPQVQQILRQLTKVDIRRVFRKRKEGQRLEDPEYRFMTNEELKQCLQDMEAKAEEKLQIPPIMKRREEINEVLSSDPAYKGYDEAKYVFTDINFGVSDRNRLIVVREPNGILRKAFWEERSRVNQIYFPHPERQLRMPHMFEDKFLLDLLERGEYEYVLDRACVQFEPDDPDYQRVTATTYDHIDTHQKFDSLQSTRHYGALAFYLVWHKRIDSMVLHDLHNNRVDDAALFIQLFHMIHPDAKSAQCSSVDSVSLVQSYIELDSAKKSILELALQTTLEMQKQHKMVEEGIKRAHGL